MADFQPSVKSFTVHKLMLAGAHLSGDLRAERELARMAEEFMELMAAGKLDPMMSKCISLEEVPSEADLLISAACARENRC